jgi:biopolymer transport protein ExbB
LALGVSILFYMFVLGDPANFEGGDPVHGHPVAENPAHTFGLIHKGGFIVPIIWSRCFAGDHLSPLSASSPWASASGKGRMDEFLHNVRQLLANDRVDEAMTACDEQQGSVANVMRNGLEKYKTVLNDGNLDKETKINIVKQEIEEATALELPMLSKNLVVISTSALGEHVVGPDRHGAGDDPRLQCHGHGRRA